MFSIYFPSLEDGVLRKVLSLVTTDAERALQMGKDYASRNGWLTELDLERGLAIPANKRGFDT